MIPSSQRHDFHRYDFSATRPTRLALFKPAPLNLRPQAAAALSGRALLERARAVMAEVYAGLEPAEAASRLAEAAAGLSPKSTPIPREGLSAKAFWINVYNALVIHGVLASDPKRSVKSSPGFFRNFRYRIAGLDLSLDDIEHGILRANRGHPVRLGLPQFAPWNPRRAYVLKNLDPRIHFALNCGAASCPPIRSYCNEALEEQLDLATSVFLSSNARVDTAARCVTLSRIFLWYRRDFGPHWPGRISWIARHHPEAEQAVLLEEAKGWPRRFLAYDWEPARPPHRASADEK